MKNTLLVLLTLSLVGCGQRPVPAGTLPYPPPDALKSSSTPAATRTPPKPDSTTGLVTGRLIHRISQTPLQGQAVYVGDLVPLNLGPEFLITLQQNSSPHDMIDQNGYFAIGGVKPGTYGLIIWNPVSSTVIPDASNPGQELRVTVQAGQTLDLGEIAIDMP